MRAWIGWLLGGLLVAACSPDFDRASDVFDLRILAVRTEPAERVYQITLYEDGVPQLDPTALVGLETVVTLLVANPPEPTAPLSYRVEGCLLDEALDCRDDELRTLFGQGESPPGEIAVTAAIPLELAVGSFQEDPFFGIYGAAVWLAGEVARGEEALPFLKSFALVPDYGQGRTANVNPEIAGILAGEEGKEAPVELDGEGRFHAAPGGKTRFLAEFPEGTRETYVVKAVDIAGLEFTTDTTVEAVWEAAYDKELTEELAVDFFGTCGRFSEDWKSEALSLAFETEEDKADKDLSVTWRAPEEPGPCTLWFVVTDGRGGVGWYVLPVAVD